jgi:hypothetical protein
VGQRVLDAEQVGVEVALRDLEADLAGEPGVELIPTASSTVPPSLAVRSGRRLLTVSVATETCDFSQGILAGPPGGITRSSGKA